MRLLSVFASISTSIPFFYLILICLCTVSASIIRDGEVSLTAHSSGPDGEMYYTSHASVLRPILCWEDLVLANVAISQCSNSHITFSGQIGKDNFAKGIVVIFPKKPYFHHGCPPLPTTNRAVLADGVVFREIKEVIISDNEVTLTTSFISGALVVPKVSLEVHGLLTTSSRFRDVSKDKNFISGSARMKKSTTESVDAEDKFDIGSNIKVIIPGVTVSGGLSDFDVERSLSRFLVSWTQTLEASFSVSVEISTRLKYEGMRKIIDDIPVPGVGTKIVAPLIGSLTVGVTIKCSFVMDALVTIGAKISGNSEKFGSSTRVFVGYEVGKGKIVYTKKDPLRKNDVEWAAGALTPELVAAGVVEVFIGLRPAIGVQFTLDTGIRFVPNIDVGVEVGVKLGVQGRLEFRHPPFNPIASAMKQKQNCEVSHRGEGTANFVVKDAELVFKSGKKKPVRRPFLEVKNGVNYSKDLFKICLGPVESKCRLTSRSGTCILKSICIDKGGEVRLSSSCENSRICCLPKRSRDTLTCRALDSPGRCISRRQCDAEGKIPVFGHCKKTSLTCCVNKPLPDESTCRDGTRSGKCIDESNCTGGNESVPGLCRGPSYIKCCLPKPTGRPGPVRCSGDGLSGICKDVGDCSKEGNISIRKLCSGGSSNQCCVTSSPCGDGTSSGKCNDESNCTGGNESVPGLCRGPSYIKCCLPKTTSPPDPIRCSGDGLSGICMDVALCSNENKVSIAGLCLGGDSSQCCVPATSCTAPGGVGRCINELQCDADKESVPNLCPGPDYIKCCAPKVVVPEPVVPASCSGYGLSGICMDVALCSNENKVSIAGLCLGGDSSQCCVPATSCTASGGVGRCINELQCDADKESVPNLCPGPDYIKCCAPKVVVPEPVVPASCSGYGLSGICMDVALCSNENKVSIAGLCLGGDSSQCCVPATSCTASGGVGRCINELQCDADKESVPNLCPGPDYIKCCAPKVVVPEPVVPASCSGYGLSGICMDVTQCSNENKVSIAGLCSGIDSNQCCVTTPSCQSDGRAGECINETQCGSGQESVSGLCPGPSYIKCCVATSPMPDIPQSCFTLDRGGECITVSTCESFGGANVAGLCQGATDIQCCISPPPACSVSGSGGVCITTALCGKRRQGSHSGFCPGPSYIQCCV